jgi:drug/metabolite transporter (DMT)-like permease
MLDLEDAHGGGSVGVGETITYGAGMAARRGRWADTATVLALITIAMWALNIPVSKLALDDWEPLAFSLVRFGVGGLIYAVWVLAREGSLRVERRDWPMFAAGGLIGIFLNQIGYMYALEKTTASTVVLIMATTPIWTALVARTLGWECVKPLFWLAIAVATFGVLLVLWGSGGTIEVESIQGDLLALLMAITWGTYSVIVRPLMDRYSPAHVSAVMMLIGTVPLLAFGGPQLARQDWGAFGPAG